MSEHGDFLLVLGKFATVLLNLVGDLLLVDWVLLEFGVTLLVLAVDSLEDFIQSLYLFW